MLTDTVGFIEKLPASLLTAFRATLEEVREADLLLEVVDSNHPQMLKQHESVCGLLAQLGLLELPRLVVLNKIDLLPDPRVLPGLLRRLGGGIPVSALTGEGLPDLLESITKHFQERRRYARIQLPYSVGKLWNLVYQKGLRVVEAFDADGVSLEGEFDPITLARVKEYIIPKE